MDVSHGGIDKVASSWTLHGWSPPWTRAVVTLRGLKSPSTWTYDSTTYRNHAKNHRVFIAFEISDPLLYVHVQLLTFRCHTLRIACVGCYLTCVLAKICPQLKLGNDRFSFGQVV